MKHFLLTTLLAIITFCSFAQTTETAPAAEENTESKDRLVLEMNWETWINTPDSIKVKNESRGVNLYFSWDMKMGESNFSFAPGFGVGISNIYFDALVLEDTNRTTLFPIGNLIDYKRSKLATTYIDVPLELRFRSKPDASGHSFKLAAIFKAGYLIQSNWKIRAKDSFNDKYVNTKRNGIRNLSQIRYGVGARIGYGDFNIQAFYHLSSLFEDTKGPGTQPIYPFSLGISFNSW